MPILLGSAALLVILMLVVHWWTRLTLNEHSGEREDYPDTGAEFAQRLLAGLDLSHVGVECTESGDHYALKEKCVRLSQENYDRRSLTALVVAAHEVGHAIQDAEDYRPLRTREVLHKKGWYIESIGSGILWVTMMFGITNPTILRFGAVFVVPCMAYRILISIVTLPTEVNASFKRAVPLLSNFVQHKDMINAKKILLACALTYVAAAVGNFFNLWRWVAVLFVRRFRF